MMCTAVTAPAGASVGGTSLAELGRWEVQGSANTTGASLMTSDGFGVNVLLLNESTANLSNVPVDADVVGAWLFWTGSEAPMAGPDNTINFRLPDGQAFNGLRTDVCQPGETPCNLAQSRCVEARTPTIDIDFYYCRREVTGLLRRLAPNRVGGTYAVGGVTADPGRTLGLPGNCAPDDPNCQAKYAGWSLVVAWQSASSVVVREAVLFDGFLFADEDFGIPGGGTGVSNTFNITGFNAKPNARAELSLFALEGDRQLGVPPQNIPGNPLFCTTCFDFLEVTTPSHPTPFRVTDGTALNEAGNIFNSSNKNGGDSVGVDVDTFNVGLGGVEPVINAGDTSLSFRLGSGDGVAGGDNGGGELFFLGYLFVALDSDAPRLANAGTFKSASLTDAAPGDTVAYTIRVTNDGAANGTNVRIADTLPTNTSYVPGSTTNTCMVNSADVGGTSPLFQANGLNLGTLTFSGVRRFCEVRFQVRINSNAPTGVITNTARISADGVMTFPVSADTNVVAPTLTRFEKTVAGATGGTVSPGTALTYTLTLFAHPTATISNIVVRDILPAELQGGTVTARPAGSTLISDASTGTVQVGNITLAPATNATITFTATVRATAADGAVIRNQGVLAYPQGTLNSDDPSTGAASDSTNVTVANRITLTTSTKTVVSPASLAAGPGTVIRWRARTINTGNRTATVTLADDLPANVGTCAVVLAPMGVACAAGGVNGTGRVTGTFAVTAGQTVDVEFTATVGAAAPDGFSVVNRATLTPSEIPASAVTVTAPGVVVTNRPVLTTSTKTLVDLNGAPARPGDTIRYTITVTNSGNRPATAVTVQDTLDTRLSVVSVGQGGTNTAGVLRWNGATTPALATLAVGASVTLTADVRINAGTPNGTVINNVGVLDSAETDPPFTTPPASFTVTATPTLSLQKTVADLGAAPFRPGDTVRYTLTLTNTGDGESTNTVVTDVLPAELTFVSATGGGTAAGNTVTWNLGNVAVGAGNARTVTVDARLGSPLDNGTVVSNQGNVRSTEVTTPLLSDNPATPAALDPTTFTVTSAPVLALTKTVTDLNGGDTLPGEEVRYTLTLTNTGDAVARNTSITDTVDARLNTLVAEGGGTVAGQVVTFASPGVAGLAAVAPGTPVTVTFRARVVSPLANGTVVPNQGRATSGAVSVLSDDPGTPAALDPTNLTVRSIPVLTVNKTVANLTTMGTVFLPSNQVQYTLTVTNSGTENATNVVVQDPVPAELTALAAPGGTLSGSAARFDRNSTAALASIAPGATVTLRITGTIVTPLDNGVVVSNQATTTADTLTPVQSNDPSTMAALDPTRFTVTSAVTLVVQKTVTDLNGGSTLPGDVVRYSLLVRNNGTANARDVVIQDPVDARLTNPLPSNGGVVGGGGIRWDRNVLPALATLGPAQQVTVTFDATVQSPLDDGTLINNQASVTGTGFAAAVSDDPNTPAAGDPTALRITSAADLAGSTKEILNAAGTRITEATPGQPLRYRITVTNRGTAVARNVTVTDTLPTQWTNAAATNGGTVAGGVVTWTSGGTAALANVAPGNSIVLDVTGQLVVPLDDGTVVGNQASLQPAGAGAPFVTDDPATAATGDQTRVTVRSAPVLTGTTKTLVSADGAPIEPGEQVTWTITVPNDGTATARNVVVTDTVDANLDIVSIGNGGTAAGNVVTWNVGTVVPGTPAVVTLVTRVRTNVSNAVTVANQARVNATGLAQVLSDDPATPANDDPTAFTVQTQPRLTLTKALGPGEDRDVSPDDQLTYVLTVTNVGSADAAGVVLRDEFPVGLAFVSASNGGTFDSVTRTVNWTVGALNAFGGTATLTLVGLVEDLSPDGTLLQNRAFTRGTNVPTEVGSDDPGTPAANDSTDVTVRATVDLTSFSKTVVDENGGQLVAGDVVAYTLTLRNTGTAPARNVTLNDPVDANLEVVEASNGGAVAGNTVTWSQMGTPALARLRPSDGVQTFTLRARVRAGVADQTPLPNQATVRALELPTGEPSDDPATGPNNDPTVIRVSAPRLVLSKAYTDGDGLPTVPGDTITYTLGLQNLGSAPATNVSIQDPLPPGLLGIVLGNGGTLTGQQASWTVGNLGAGARVDLTVTAQVDPALDGMAVLTNRATVRATEVPVPVESDDPATAAVDATIIRLAGRPSLVGSTLVIDGAPTEVRPRDPIRFTITILNSGNSPANGVSVDATLDGSIATPVVEDGGNLAGPQARWDASGTMTLARLAPNARVVLHFRGTVASPLPDGITISQGGNARAVNADAVTLGPATVRVNSKPRFTASALEVTDANSGEVEPGDLLTWRLSVLNDGTTVGRNVRVSLPVPASTRYVQGTATVRGVPVPDVAGESALTTSVTLGDVEAGQATVVTMQVRVAVDTPRAFTLGTQGWISTDEVPAVPSDDPRTPEILGDATNVVVGGGALLNAVLLAVPSVTADGRSTLRLVVENQGSRPAADVLVQIPSAPDGQYVPRTLTFNGLAQTDEPDADNSGLELGGWYVRMPTLESGQALVATVSVQLRAGAVRAEYQGTVGRPGGVTVSTDGDPAAPGAQLTPLTRTGGGVDLSASTISVVDVNGGVALPGDILQYTVVLANRGAVDAQLSPGNGLSSTYDPNLQLLADSVDPPALFRTDVPNRQVLLTNATPAPVIRPGENLVLRFRARIAAATDTGEDISTFAVATLDGGVTRNIGPVTLVVGDLPGAASLRGVVWQDTAGANNVRTAGEDQVFAGWQVLLFAADAGARATPIRSALTNDVGAYDLQDVAPGSYRVRVTSRGGAQFAQVNVVGLQAGERRTQDLRIDPSGVIYDSHSGQPLAGVKVTLFEEDSDNNPINDAVVPADRLPPGQQDQVTGPDGRYRFDPFAGRYRLELSGPQPTSVWPSGVIDVSNDDNSPHPYGSFARTDAQGLVVPQPVPDARNPPRYYLRFNLTDPNLPVLNNHIPVDPLQSHVRLIKQANKRFASVGDLVTYTVRVTNTSPVDMTVERMGGVEVADSIPAGFSYIRGSARMDRVSRDAGGRTRRERLPAVEPAGKRLLTFGAVDLFARSDLELRYQLAVGPSVPFGQHVNRAVARAAAGQQVVSNESSATVEIRPETLFDDGTVLGKVFCDRNQDGWQDVDEEGVLGVRVMVDTGFYAETDEFGRFHITSVPPGTHLAKVDEHTIPPGGTLTTPLRQMFYVTRGLPTRFSFGVTCPTQRVTGPTVTLNEDAYPADYVPPPPEDAGPPAPDQLHISGVRSQRVVSLNGVPQETIRADLGVTFGTQDPLIGQGVGPNLMAFDAVKGLGLPLTFHPRVKTSLPISGWRLVVEDEDSHSVVHVAEGDGAVPATLGWDATDAETRLMKLERGHRYIVTLAAVATNGDVGVSAPRRFGIAVGAAAEAPGHEAMLDEAKGPLFDKKNKPTPDTRTWMRTEAPKLGTPSETQVVLEVHGDDKMKPADQKLQEARALWMKEQLVALGFDAGAIEIRTPGAEEPRVPNMGNAQRARNRRLVMKSKAAAVLGDPLAPVEVLARVNLNGMDLAVSEEQTFESDVPVRVGDIVRVDVTTDKGQRFIMNRLYTGQPFAPGAPPPPGTSAVELKGDVLDGLLSMDSVPVNAHASTPVDAVVDGDPNAPFMLDDKGVPDRELALKLNAPADTVKWKLQFIAIPPPSAQQAPVDGGVGGDADGGVGTGSAGNETGTTSLTLPVFAADDVVVFETEGQGAPPARFSWSGANASGASVLRPGLLRYRFSAELPLGLTAYAPDGLMGFTSRPAPITLANPFTPAGKLSLAARMTVLGLANQWKQVGGRVLITAHTDAGKPRMKALFETQQQADALKAAFAELGVPDEAMDAAGRGFQEPVMTGTGPKAAQANRRVDVLFQPPSLAGVVLPALPPAVEVNGTPVVLAGTAFAERTYATRGEKLVVAWRDGNGRRTVLALDPPISTTDQTPATLADILGPKPASTLVPLPEGYVLPAQGTDAVPEGFATWSGDADGGTAPAPSEPPPPAAQATYWAPGGIPLAMGSMPVPPPPPSLDLALAPVPPRRPLPNPAEVLAADLTLDMPPEGATFGADRLLIRGITHPLNVVRVNGQEAVVDPATGRFTAIVRLAEGTNTVAVETEDVRGNKGTLSRNYTLDTTGFFFMGLADTATAAGARLDEFNQYNSIAPVWSPQGGFSWRGGPLTFYGRGVAYARGRWKGFWRIPFVEATLHLDSQRWNNPAQEFDLLGQLNYYPTFGDNALQIQEARARYPLYVRVKGGNNELFVGNATAQLGYGDLARYGRARYGALLTVDQDYVQLKPLGGVDLGHTRAKLMMAGGDTPRRPAHVEMRGTGGSLYFLKDRYLIEGSERVYVVVRDAITGNEMARRMLTRNTDYTIRYAEGRLWLNAPLMSVEDGSLITNTNPTAITQGNPAYLVVDYEHAGDGDFSEFGVGGAVEQTVLDHVAVGGIYTLEGRRDQQPSYQLGGVHARAFWDQDNYVSAEAAYSRAVNVDNAISNDGGLSWQPMGAAVNTGPAVSNGTIYPGERQGGAYKLKGQIALGRLLFGRAPTDLYAKGYFQRVQGGFYADGVLTDQGQWKYGTEAFWQFTQRDSIRARWDGVWAEVPLLTQVPEYRLLHRELALLQAKHTEGPFTLTGEYALQYTEDSRGFGRVNWADFRRRVMNVVAGQVDFKLSRNLTLLARQEGVLTADERVLPRWNDRLTTTVGARLQVLERVELSATETLRWNGENATNIGIKTRVAENADVYAQQRFQLRQNDWVNTSVVGASNGTADGTRTYTEVQHDMGMRGEQTRGVLGASHNWTLLEGVTLQMGYERTQVLGNSGQGVGPATANPNGTPVNAAFSDSYAFSQPGAVGANPQWMGTGSRDAFFAQMNFAYFKWLKVTSRVEVRYDNQDERRGGNDRLMFFTQNNLAWNWTQDLTFIGRFNLADVQNRTLNVQEAALQELAAGLAYRPIRNEWFSVLAMVRHRLELRPIMLTDGRFERTTSDVLSIEPILELPFGLQLVEKVAFKYSREKVDNLPEGNAFMGLWINRLNYHAFRLVKRFVPQLNRFNGDIDLALEYRIRALITQSQVDHGFVTEVGIVPVPYVRIGLGFNFSRVSDDVFAKNNQNAFGPYVRMQAQY